MQRTPFAQRFSWLQSPAVLLASIFLGGLFGFLWPSRTSVLYVFAEIYIDLLQLLVAPLILCSIILNIQGMFSERAYAKTGLRALSGLLLMAVLPALVGMAAAYGFQPGSELTKDNVWRIEKVLGGNYIDHVSRINFFSETLESHFSSVDSVINAIFPSNIFQALAQGEEIKIAVFAIMFGFAVAVLSSRLKEDFNQSLVAVISACFKISSMFAHALPVAIFTITAHLIAHIGADALILMAHFVLTFFAMALAMCALSFVALTVRSDASMLEVLSSLKPTLSISMVAGEHSSVCMPQMVDTLANKLGFAPEKVEFLVPLATCFVRSAPIMYFAMATVFVAQIYGHAISPMEYMMIWGMSIALGFASLGLQSSNKLALLAVICNPLGLPTEAVVLLLLAVEPLCALISGLTMSMTQCACVALISHKPVRL
jgi:Na+/H+-dicarboxylate symporter